MTNAEFNPDQNPMPVTIDHVADGYRCYPGETVTFYSRVSVRETVPGLTLSVSVPAGLVVGDYQAPPVLGGTLPRLVFEDGARDLTWGVTEELKAGTQWEYQVSAQVAATERDTTLQSRARVVPGGDATLSAEESVTVDVFAKSRYLRYLPALYGSDELMGRFLMLFESFWTPVERQIDDMALYFDPKMTPRDFLPWLASWFSLVLDERLSEERQRRLIQSAVWLYRKRGTKQGLKEYLEIYTGGRAEIVEYRAHNFILGPQARLGPSIALGTGNMPHTFSVELYLPPDPAPARDGPPKGDRHEQERRELEHRRLIEALIEAEKPAQTYFTLHIETE